MPLMRTTSDVQRDMTSVAALCHETREPVYITRNGQADLVIMDAQAYDEQTTIQRALYEREKRTMEAIQQGYEEYLRGEGRPLSVIRAERDAKIAKGEAL